MNVEPPETFVIIESIVYKSNGFAIFPFAAKDFINSFLEVFKASIAMFASLL